MESNSEYQKAWRRFRRNRPAWAGLWFVAAAVFVALFGYALAPDDTPDSNTQMPEIALQSPGYQASILQVKLGEQVESAPLWAHLLHGSAAAFKPIAVRPESLHWSADSVHFQYVGNHLRSGSLVKSQLVTPNLETRYYLLGTDKYGRCIWSRLLLGFRVSLTVGLISVVISLSIGVFLGAMGGYFGGRLDDAVMLLVNTVWSIPTLLLVFAVVLALGRGIGIIFLAVGLTMWVDVARVVRGQVLTIRQLAYVEAAKSMGMGHARILIRHVLPNLLGPVMVVTAGNFATAILLESGLSYLGFGVQPPTPSWGTMLNEHYGYALGGKPLLALAPAVAIAVTVLAFNLVGNGLRDALDVKN